MKCVICKHGEPRPGTATVTMHRDATTIVVKNVPAEVCGTCGEYYLESDVARYLQEVGNAAVARGAEVEILRYVNPAA
jgi:YgiT-type zinc finger domain-containing protein